MTHTQIFAHRGANREAAENTQTAFDLSLQHKIDGIETDVQLSRDNVPVLWHDRTLKKLGLADRRIDDFDYAELAKMNFGQHFAPDRHESIMKLADFIERYAAQCRLLIEIKNREWENIERHQLKMRQSIDMLKHYPSALVSSFNLDSLVYAHQYAPKFPLVYNIEPEQTLADIQTCLTQHSFLYGYCLPISSLDQAVVDCLRQHGKAIAVYTCNHNDEIQLALRLGVDILISDLPEYAIQHMTQ